MHRDNGKDDLIKMSEFHGQQAQNPTGRKSASVNGLTSTSMIWKVTSPASKGPGNRGHIVADTLLLMMFLGLRKLGNICCGHKLFLNKIRNIFCVRNKCCPRGQTGKHLCRQQCVRNNVFSFARALRQNSAIFSRFRNVIAKQYKELIQILL